MGDGDASVVDSAGAAAFVDIATVAGDGESGLSGEEDEVCSVAKGDWEGTGNDSVDSGDYA